jgi:hypothetical protein
MLQMQRQDPTGIDEPVLCCIGASLRRNLAHL